MRLPRFTIGRLMLLVAAIGANIGACRLLAARDVERCVVAALMIVAVQLGLWAAARGPVRYRPFWTGFVALGLLCPATLLSVEYGPNGAAPRTWMVRYLEWSIKGLLEWLNPLLRPCHDVLWLTVIALALIAFLPQLVVAVVGGVLGQWIIGPTARWLWTRRGDRII